ncbi:MAG: triose-phosphate isomerase [Clostridiales bacterium]|nr:triose-phosphate isomerase [Clostridiales bacterium]
MKKIIGNFKMNQTPSQTKDYLINFLPRVDATKNEIILCFPATSLTTAKFLVEGRGVKLGGQNICDEEINHNMGEVNGVMIREAGAEYVVVGHSERRSKYKENTRTNNRKIKIALKNRLKVILCVGENLAERNTLKMLDSLKNQIEESLKGIYENELQHITIAYEPIWAIGTGKLPTNKELENAVKAIRKVICDDFSEKAGQSIDVVYGGSLDAKNIGQYLKLDTIDGFFVGGSCLDPAGFAQIIKLI